MIIPDSGDGNVRDGFHKEVDRVKELIIPDSGDGNIMESSRSIWRSAKELIIPDSGDGNVCIIALRYGKVRRN